MSDSTKKRKPPSAPTRYYTFDDSQLEDVFFVADVDRTSDNGRVTRESHSIAMPAHKRSRLTSAGPSTGPSDNDPRQWEADYTIEQTVPDEPPPPIHTAKQKRKKKKGQEFATLDHDAVLTKWKTFRDEFLLELLRMEGHDDAGSNRCPTCPAGAESREPTLDRVRELLPLPASTQPPASY
ncbi:hypothetical protein K474DRAFT_1680998 [Panus rudis PR-1116 ss-1]|nr:hypothetical protein K474DRAFT_1680998 [Panus rudis PR-1116 ss-1]